MISFSRKNLISHLLIVAALICVGLISIQMITNSDIWLWLKVGEIITQTGKFPTKDFLSHTASGREWVVHAWGFGVLSFITHRYFGELGLAAFRLTVSLLVFFILRKTAKVLKGPAVLDTRFAVIICFSFSIMSNAWMSRPHLLGSLYVSLLMLILTLYRAGKRVPILAVPLLTMVWANTHASLPIALAIMLLLLGSEVLEKLLRPGGENTTDPRIKKLSTIKPFRFRLLTVIILTSFLTSLINPYHFKIYQYFFKINSLVKENILEWLPLSHFFGWSVVGAFLIFMALAIGTLIIIAASARKKIPYFEVGLTIVSAYLALSALRHIIIATLVLTPIFVRNTSILLEKAKARLSSKVSLLLPLLAFVAIIILASSPFKKTARGEWGIARDLVSSEAINFVKEVRPRGNMYNHFNFGSTLIWHLYPEHKTFIDGRVDMFVPDIYQEWLAVAMNKEGWEETLEKYEVGWIIFTTGGIWPGLRESLKKEDTWCLVFWDDTASIILRKEQNVELCQRYAYRTLNPWDPEPPQEVTEEVKEECQRALESSSWNASAYNKLGMIYALEEKFEEAREQFRMAIKTNPQYTTAYLNLATLEERKDPQKAIAVLEAVIKENPAASGPFKKIALIYRNLGEMEKTRKYLLQYQKRVEAPQEKEWAEQELKRLN